MRRKLATLVSTAGLLCTMTLSAGIVLAGNPAADIDQCANDAAPSFSYDGCATTATQWVNGNLGASKSVYNEGDSIPYRIRLSNLSLTGTRSVTIEWDTTKSGKHALDYIDDFDESVNNPSANPCLGVTPCDPTSFGSVSIPIDPQLTSSNPSVTPKPGLIRVYGGSNVTLTRPAKVGSTTCTNANSLGSYCYSSGTGFAGDKSAAITINFTATRSNPVIAWGGHIATRLDWGSTASAVAISGSPYHTRLVDLDGSGGNQDRSLSAAAVVFPGSITIVKDARPDSATAVFPFTAGPTPLVDFNLTDDGTVAHNTKTFPITADADFKTYTVTEGTTSGWSFGSASCGVTSPNTGTQTVSGATATINLKEGENVTCTYINTANLRTLSITKTDDTVSYDHVGQVITFTITATNTGNVTQSITVSDTPALAGFSCTPTNGGAVLPGDSMVCTGTHSVTLADLNAGSFDDTACANATGATQACAPDTVPASQRRTLSITKDNTFKDANGIQFKYDHVGQVIGYTITATNTGNVTQSITVTDTPPLDNFSCTPTNGSAILPQGTITCTGTHTVTDADMATTSFIDTACANAPGATEACDPETVYRKNIPGVVTTPSLVPNDHIVLSGLSGTTTGGDLIVELQVGTSAAPDCGTADPFYTKTFPNAGNNFYDTSNTKVVDADSALRWCTMYTGDANNAARGWSSDNELIRIDFYPFGAIFAGFGGAAIPLIAWALWSRRRREAEKTA